MTSAHSRVSFSGIKPSGEVHLGNYIGAIKQWVTFQENMKPGDVLIFPIVDLHAITVPFEPLELRERLVDLVCWLMASGLDPKKVIMFVQSENPDHPYLAWLFNCITPMGWLERMTQYKDKARVQGQRVSVGLFDYPSLMAADILLYDTHDVPVGEDQKQHVELARNIAERFNRLYGETFRVPYVVLREEGARLMSLQDPTKKMSKSDEDKARCILLKDDADTIRQKIRRAVTDSGNEIHAGKDKPALTNLMVIYSEFSGKSLQEIEALYQGKSYSEFKHDLAEIVVEGLAPVQEKYRALKKDQAAVGRALSDGLKNARAISSEKIKHVQKAMGLEK